MNKLFPQTALGAYRLAVSAFFFSHGLVFASWACRIPDIKNALGMNEAQLGIALLVSALGSMCTLTFSGTLVGRLGSRNVVMLASVAYPAMLMVLGVAPSFIGLSLALFFFGSCSNLMNISVNTQGVGVERLYRRSIMAGFHGLWSMAGFTGGLLGWLAVRFGMSPLHHFMAVFGICLLIPLLFGRILLPRDAKRAPEQKGNIISGMNSYVLLIGLIACGSMVSEGAMFDWSGVYFEDVVRPGAELVSVGYVAFMATMTLGRFIADAIVTRYGTVSVLKGSGALTALGLMIAVVFPDFWPATAGFLLVGFGVSSVVPLCYSLAGKSSKTTPGVAIAAVSAIGFVGFFLGPPVIGFIAHSFSLRWSFTLIAVLGLGTAVLAPLIKGKKD